MVKNCDLSLKKYFFQDLGHSFSPYGPPSRQITYISHLKEDKISFSEKIYLASKNPWILNHAKKMAYNLHKSLYNF